MIGRLEIEKGVKMAVEIEAKFKLEEEEVNRVEEKLREIAEFVIDKVEEDLYFSSYFRNFLKTDEAVRIRKDVEGVTLTYKGPKMDEETKTREEIKVRIFPDDYENAIAFLEKVGFKRFAKVEKRRRIYRKDNALICLDTLEGLGSFIEIEVEGNLEVGKREIFNLAGVLGITSESIRKSYLELLLEERT